VSKEVEGFSSPSCNGCELAFDKDSQRESGMKRVFEVGECWYSFLSVFSASYFLLFQGIKPFSRFPSASVPYLADLKHFLQECLLLPMTRILTIGTREDS
jgi:hypothetical protein